MRSPSTIAALLALSLVQMACITSVEVQTPNLTKPVMAGFAKCAEKPGRQAYTHRQIQVATPLISRDLNWGSPAETELEMIQADPTDAKNTAVPEIDFSSHGGNYVLLGYSSTHIHYQTDSCAPAPTPGRGKK